MELPVASRRATCGKAAPPATAIPPVAATAIARPPKPSPMRVNRSRPSLPYFSVIGNTGSSPLVSAVVSPVTYTLPALSIARSQGFSSAVAFSLKTFCHSVVALRVELDSRNVSRAALTCAAVGPARDDDIAVGADLADRTGGRLCPTCRRSADPRARAPLLLYFSITKSASVLPAIPPTYTLPLAIERNP